MSPSENLCDVSVVLPIYNERGHLRDEITRIQKALDDSKYSYEIIVIDDGSNDGSSATLNRSTGFASSGTRRTVARVPRAAPARTPRSVAWSCGPTST